MFIEIRPRDRDQVAEGLAVFGVTAFLITPQVQLDGKSAGRLVEAKVALGGGPLLRLRFDLDALRINESMQGGQFFTHRSQGQLPFSPMPIDDPEKRIQ